MKDQKPVWGGTLSLVQIAKMVLTPNKLTLLLFPVFAFSFLLIMSTRIVVVQTTI